MIRVTIEVYDGTKTTVVADLSIVNDRLGDHDIGNYRLSNHGEYIAPIKGHMRSKGFWPLVRRALNIAEAEDG